MTTVENISVLLVESDDILRAIYSKIIARQVREVLTATNGEDGFQVYQSHRPDIIITDIKLPVINGIDMVKKIRSLDKSVRVIIMSAFVDVKYFIQAIEAEVKGFLTKPVDSEKLEKLLNQQVHEILLERQIEEEGRKRREAERDREKSDYILRILSETTALFFQQGITSESINNTLELIGHATSASRLYIFEKQKYKKGDVLNLTYDWVDKGIESQKDNEDLANVPVDSLVYKRWNDLLKDGIIIQGDIETDFPEDKELVRIMVSLGVQSVLIIPIFIQSEWWGFIGLDECKRLRQWSEVEINALQLVANNVGAAFYRKRVEFELLSLNAQLENRVKERTKELEVEVAERKHTEVLLRESEEKYRLIFENANDGIILVNKSGEVLMVNPRMVEVFDMIPRKIIGKHFCDFIDEEFRKSTKSILSDKSSEEFYSTIDVTITQKNGHVRWLELKPARIIWDGELATLVFVSDVTLRKNAEDELNKLNLHLENRIREEVQKVEQQQQLLIQKSKLESMGELAAGLAHEINQPLGGISMGLDNILYKLNENELTNDYLVSKISVLFKDIERIRNIINHVRVFSRDQQSIQKEKVEVSKIVKNTLSLVEKQFNSEHIQIQTNLGNKPVFIYVNPYRVEQVLLNLLSNARYAVNKKSSGGAGSSYKKKVIINIDVKSSMVLISIEDNGIGMKDEIKNKIFEPFFTTKDLESGTGIGLSISYGIVKESNGRIFAQSAPNKGTKMFVELPII